MKSNAKLGSKELLVLDENFDFQNKITDKPIEGEQNISDHLNNDPLSISLSINVNKNGKAEAVELEKMRDSKQVYDYVTTDEKVYENMAIKSLSIPKSANIKDGFSGSITLQQVQIIEQDTQKISLGKDPITGIQAQETNKQTESRLSQKDSFTENGAAEYNKIGYSR